MHRSGTSALARVLSLLGVHLGESPMAGNAEHAGLVQAHDELLTSLGRAWDDPRPISAAAQLSDDVAPIRQRIRAILERDFAGRALWGVKDPRLCRLVPLWRSLLEEMSVQPRFVLTNRAASAVIASLARRDGIPEAKAGPLWLEHALSAERDTRGLRRSFVTYEALLADWRAHVVRIGRDLGMDWRDDVARAAPQVTELLDSALHPHRAGAEVAEPPHPWLRAVEVIWDEATGGADPGPALAAIRDRLETAGRLFFPWTSALEKERVRLGDRLRDAGARPAGPGARSAPDPAPAAAPPTTTEPAARPGAAARS
jgi:hypothetical protein